MEGNCLSTVFLKHFFKLLFDLNASFAEKMKLALEKKDSDLAAAQKEAQEKTALAGQKLASVETLEGQVTKLNSCLNEKLESAVRNEKLYLMLEGISFRPTGLMLANRSYPVDSLIFGCRILPRL